MQIVKYPHPTLRHESKPLKRVDAELRRLIRQMFELMYEARGVGLAANQVDLPLRMFVVNLAADPGKGDEMVFINPVLSHPKGTAEEEEGCLSIPELYGPVVRPKTVRISAFNEAGEAIEADLDNMYARVVQHEFDHLEGVLFTDRMTSTAMADARPALDDLESRFAMRREAGEIPPDDQIADRLLEWERRYC